MPEVVRFLRRLSKRRRPIARRAEFVDLNAPPLSPLLLTPRDHSEDCRRRDNTPVPLLQPKRLMQRLSHWLGGHLPGGRKRREASLTRQPTISSPLGSVAGAASRQPQMFGGTMETSIGPAATETRRRTIQTNPWYPPPPPSESARSAGRAASALLDVSYSSSLSQLTRDESLRINTLTLHGSCSSGYGSQDSSPECSMHQQQWQPSSLINTRGRLVDKAVDCRSFDFDAELLALHAAATNANTEHYDDDDEHVYHQLELPVTRPNAATTFASPSFVSELDRCCYALSGAGASSSSSSSICTSSRAESPVYAVPYSSADESRCASIEYVDDSDGYAELLARRYPPETSASYGGGGSSHDCEGSGYARLRRFGSVAVPPSSLPPPLFHAPPPPSSAYLAAPPQHEQRNCLDLLDEQIGELKRKTELVSRLVETAKARRELRDSARTLCHEHIQRLRSMRRYIELNI